MGEGYVLDARYVLFLFLLPPAFPALLELAVASALVLGGPSMFKK